MALSACAWNPEKYELMEKVYGLLNKGKGPEMQKTRFLMVFWRRYY